MSSINFYDLSNQEKREYLQKVRTLIKENKSEDAKKILDNLNVADLETVEKYNPFPLTDIQESFSVGKYFGKNFDNVGCHVYFEFEEENLDIQRLNETWNRLVDYHEMLQVVILPDRKQRIKKDIPNYDFVVYDMREKSPEDIDLHFNSIRNKLSHKLYEVDQWPLFEICITVLDNGRNIIHFSMDEWIVDGSSLSLIFNQWYNLYKNPEFKLPMLDFNFRDYVKIQKEREVSSKYKKDLEFWMNKYAKLPGGPSLPYKSNPTKEQGKSYFTRKRYSEVIDKKYWDGLKAIAQKLEVSNTSMLLMCFSELLYYWSSESSFSIIVTFFNRPPVNRNIDKVVGPFVSTNIFAIEDIDKHTIKEKVKCYQQKLWEDLDHSSVSGIRALRELRLRDKKVPNLSVPVVFTSMINNAGKNAQDSWLEKATYSISQTPQVCLDHQVHEKFGSLYIMWDIVEEYFEDGVAQKMFKEYIRLICTLATRGDMWEKASLIDYIRMDNKLLHKFVNEIPFKKEQVSKNDSFQLSDMQQANAFGHIQNKESCMAYQEFDIEKLDVQKLQKAFNSLIKIHDMLRTVINGKGSQKILDEVPEYIIEVKDLRQNADIDVQLEEIRKDKLEKRFDLNKWPLYDLTVSTLKNNRSRVHFTIDALIADGRSILLLYKQLFMMYKNPCYEIQKPEISFCDYIQYMNHLKNAPECKSIADYWKEKFDTMPSGPMLPYKDEKVGQAVHRRIEGKINNWEKLERKAQELAIDPGILLFTAYTEVLAMWSKTLPFTTVFVDWNRIPMHPDINKLIGEFTSLSWVVTSDSNLSFVEKARCYQEIVHNDLGHGIISGLSQLRKKMLQNVNHESLQLPVVFTNSIGDDGIELGSDISLGYGISLTPGVYLDNMSYKQGDSLLIYWDFDASVFQDGIVEEMFNKYEEVLKSLADDTSSWDDLKTKMTYTSVIDDNTALIKNDLDYSKFKCIHTIFEEQAQKNPYAVALTFNGQNMMYGELNNRANQLAHYLRRFNVSNQKLIGICMERSLEMIVAILGVLKSGYAYIPLDPNYPKERLELIIDDSQIPVLITQEKCLCKISTSNKMEIICMDRDKLKVDMESNQNLQINVKLSDIAYVIYTSGSTGKPKGALISHYNVVRLFKSTYQWFKFNDKDVWTLFHSYAFDFSVWEIWGSLLYGGRLVIVPYNISRMFDEFYKLVVEEKVTVLNQTPTAFRQFMLSENKLGKSSNLALRYIIFGGEALNLQCLRPWFSSHGDKVPQLVNMYGITETTVHVTYRPITMSDMDCKASVIGEPIPDLQLYLLDENLNKVPTETPGEIFVGGAGLASGYLNRPVLTSEKFISNPFSNNKSDRLYKTGDAGMFLPNGDIEYLGRIDLQVKIRGFRIELGDIENALLGHELIKEAVVEVQDKDTDVPKIVAYIIPSSSEEPLLKDIRHHMRNKLPDYMVPNIIVTVKEFPLTENGKLNRKALPWPVDMELKKEDNKQEKEFRDITPEIIVIFKEALESNEEISENDDIFDLGATSLTLMTITQLISERYGVAIPVEVFLSTPTIKDVVKYIKDMQMGGEVCTTPESNSSIGSGVEKEELNNIEATMDVDDNVKLLGEVIAIFKEALESTEEISENDDIFDLGATSLTLMTITQIVSERYGMAIPVEVFLSTSTIKDVVKYLKDMQMSGEVCATLESNSSIESGVEKEELNNIEATMDVDDNVKLLGEVIAIFKEALESTEEISENDDIFDLGATSLTLMTITQIMSDRYGVSIPVEVFLSTPTIKDVVKYLKDTQTSGEVCTTLEPNSSIESDVEKESLNNLEVAISLGQPNFRKDVFIKSSSTINFENKQISFENFSNFLGLLKMEKVKGESKYLYPSAGGRNCVQTYVYIKKDAVEGLVEGIYYYNTLLHRLFPILQNIEIGNSVNHVFNQPIFEHCSFMVFFVAQLNAVKPVYVDYSACLSRIDTGYMSQLLLSRQSQFNIGLYPTIGLDFKQIEQYFKLDSGHMFVFSLMGGFVDYRSDKTCFDGSELIDNIYKNSLYKHYTGKTEFDTIDSLLKIQRERKFNILSRKDLVLLTKQQMHIRKFQETDESIELASCNVEHSNYILRSSQRHYIDKMVPFEDFSKLLSLLRKEQVNSGYKGLYTSPAVIPGLDIFLYIKECGVESIEEGIYKYDTQQNQLIKINDTLSQPISKCHTPFNIAISKEAKFFIFLVLNNGENKNLLGDEYVNYAEIEAGTIGQVLLDRQSEFNMGLVPIGGMNFESIYKDFNIELENVYIHSFMCGAVEYEQKRDPSFAIEQNENTEINNEIKEAEKNAEEQYVEKEKMYYPLSYGQKSIYFEYKTDPMSSAYNTAYHVRIKFKLNIEVFSRAINLIIIKHPLMRATFTIEDGNPYQIIHEIYKPTIKVVDASNWSEDKLIEENKKEYNIAFDLENMPAFRITLFKIKQDDIVIMFNIHHIITDFMSTGIIVKDLWNFYEMLLKDPQNIPEVTPNFKYFDYVSWQDEMLNNEDIWNYWKKNLGGELPVLNLPKDRPRLPMQTKIGATKKFIVDRELTSEFREFAKKERKSLYTIMLTAFMVLLYRYSRQEDILVGTTANARVGNKYNDTFGYFINPIVIRGDLSGYPTFRDLLNKINTIVYSALEHQNYPFMAICEKLHPVWDAGISPIFQVTFQFISKLMTSKQNSINSGIEFFEIPQQEGQFDIDFEMMEEEDYIDTHIMYNRELFNDSTIERFKTHFVMLLRNIISDPDKKIISYDFIDSEERELVIKKWNNTEVSFNEDKHIHNLFEEHALRKPDEIAVVGRDEHGTRRTITYNELNTKANQLANHLREVVGENHCIIGICLTKSIELVISVMAVFKAGFAYVPIDPEYPINRKEFILSDSNSGAVLTETRFASDFKGNNISIVEIDKTFPILDKYDNKNLNVQIPKYSLAYVIYTSGSTGTPKGVKIIHEGVTNIFYGYQEGYLLENICKTHLQMANFTFDVFVGDFIRSLCSGGKLILCPREYLLNPEQLYNIIQTEKVEFAEFVPAVIRHLVQYMKRANKIIDSMKALVISSDSWNMKEYFEFKEYFIEGTRFINAYGVTEVTIDSTFIDCDKIQEDSQGFVPIGRPFPNTELYILDKELNPTPIGIAGELCIGGKGVAAGYMNRSELTAEKFVRNPFKKDLDPSKPEAFMYRTGDLAYYLPNGVVGFLGRIDNQVKIRGLRIEVGEIESVLSQHPMVKEAVVLAKKDQSGENILIGYYTENINNTIGLEELHAFMRNKLPEYMVPSVFIKVEEFLLNSNGKVDRNALPGLDASIKESVRDYTEARNYTERKLVEIWKNILQIEKVGINNDFFSVGGHSFIAIKLIDKIEKELNFRIPLTELLVNPTIQHLAKIIDGKSAVADDSQSQDAMNIDFEEEARIEGKLGSDWFNPKRILLTGATGSIGTNLLIDILKTYKSADVYCLVRAEDDAAALRKIENSIKRQLLCENYIMTRIVPVIGDLEKPLLGLTEQKFEELSTSIDIIFHNGAFVNFVYPYSVLKKANVLGTIEILKLAARSKIKPLHYISTISVYDNIHLPEDKSGQVIAINDDTELIQNEGLKNNIGYTQSKWVAEKIVQNAREQGLPITIYRPDTVSGNSVTGVWNTGDFACKTIRSMALSGIIPNKDVFYNWMPVDYVSSTIVYLSTKANSMNKNFNMVSPYTFSISELASWITSLGYPIKKVPINKWKKQLKENMESKSELSEIPAEVFEAAEKYDPHKVLKYMSDNVRQGLQGSGIECPKINKEIIKKYFDYFNECGFIEKP